mgnify:CR=1 FL=1
MLKKNLKNSLVRYVAVSITAFCITLTTTQVTIAQEGASLVEEIVVTAQKRSESLQEVPISIQVFSSDDIERLAVTNTIDLVRNVPGMVGVTNVGLPQAAAYFIRGIGQDESVSTLDPAVGTFVDGVFLSRQIANNSRLYDIESVEVLKGPQGTLYGRSTTGGAVRIITKKPTEETEGWFDICLLYTSPSPRDQRGSSIPS